MVIDKLLFDYDGTLGHSERKAFEACCTLVNEVLAANGVSRQFTPTELHDEFVGCSFRRMVTELSTTYGFTVESEKLEELVLEEENRVIAKLLAEMEATDGVNKALADLQDEYGMAVVSSSALRRLRACLKRADQERFFAAEHVFSAASSLPAPTPKPAPDVYLHAVEVLGTSVDRCLAIEDSKTGVKAAVAANIKVVGYVGSYPEEERDAMAAVLRDAGAIVVFWHWDDFSAVLDDIRRGAAVNA